MTDRLSTALRRLEAALAAQGNPVLRGLAPGIPEAQLRQRLEEWGLDPPQDLITLFSWHNGYVQPDGEPFAGRIGSGIQLLSLEQGCEAYTRRVRFDIEILIENSRWSESTDWFPFAVTTSGAYFIIDCRRDSTTRGTVASWETLEATELQYRPASLAEPVEWWAEYLETGAWRWDPISRTFDDSRDFSAPNERLFSGLG